MVTKTDESQYDLPGIPSMATYMVERFDRLAREGNRTATALAERHGPG